MDRKYWLVPLLTAFIGVMGTLGGSWVAGYQHERAAARQAHIDLANQLTAERTAELKAFKEAGLRYMNATDALVNNLVFAPTRDKALADHLALVQSAANEVMLIGDEELTQQTITVNQTIARLLMPSAKPMEQRLGELNVQVLAWIKSFKRGLDALKTQNEEALGLHASVQVAKPLKR
jgi:hypothetical protein